MDIFSSIVFISCPFLRKEKNTTIEWDDGGKVGNKNKLILSEIFLSVQETWYLKVMDKL